MVSHPPGPPGPKSPAEVPTLSPARPAEALAPEPPPERRHFLFRLAAVTIGGLIGLFPFAAGLLVFTGPLRRRAGANSFVRVTTLDAVPDDGVPRRFTVYKTRVDAWNSTPNEPVGAVYLRRLKGAPVPVALQSTCPHAGCMLEYRAVVHEYKCPCHNSAFELDGQIIQPSPAPRPMDTLACEVRTQEGVKEVWVDYQNFYTGVGEKKAKI